MRRGPFVFSDESRKEVTLEEKLREIEARNSYYFEAGVFKIATGEDCENLLAALRLAIEQRDYEIECGHSALAHGDMKYEFNAALLACLEGEK